MIRLATTAVLGATLAAQAAWAAPDVRRFDGAWSVVATTEDGACTGPYRYPITIRGGAVDEAGGADVDASGRADASGRIVGTIRSGPSTVAVTGRLKGASGSGRWTLTGLTGCSGRWSARKSG